MTYKSKWRRNVDASGLAMVAGDIEDDVHGTVLWPRSGAPKAHNVKLALLHIRLTFKCLRALIEGI